MAVEYRDQLLEETPTRAVRFLTGLGAVPGIRSKMHAAGMSDADITEGSQLLARCVTPRVRQPSLIDTASAQAQRAAVHEISGLETELFARAQATLARHHAGVGQYVFQGLDASQGAESVAGMLLFLKRLEMLESGSDPNRAESRAEDKAAVELLASRGINKALRQHLASQVQLALGPTEILDPQAGANDANHERRQSLISLRMWFEEWSGIARAVISKRGELIRLGLASRRRKTDEEDSPALPKVEAEASSDKAKDEGALEKETASAQAEAKPAPSAASKPASKPAKGKGGKGRARGGNASGI